MNKTKIFALIAIAAILSACGSDDGSPPSLKNSDIGLISPFDTLKAEFDSEITNLNELSKSDILSSIDIIRVSLSGKKSNKIYFIGSGSTKGGGWHDFGDGLKDETIIFKNLKNQDGYVAKSVELKFSTYPVYDIEQNGSEEEAGDLASYLSTSAKKVIFAGILDHKFEVNASGDTTNVERDAADFYKLELKESETISITASSKTAPLKVRFYGDCPRPTVVGGCLNDTLAITKDNKSVTLSKVIPGGHWPEGATIGSKVTFYIKVFDIGIGAPVNPYTIEVKIK